MTPPECRDYLGHLQHFGIKLGLENIAALCLALGNPQNRFLSIHVAGTNGKGSVSAMLAGIMRGTRPPDRALHLAPPGPGRGADPGRRRRRSPRSASGTC